VTRRACVQPGLDAGVRSLLTSGAVRSRLVITVLLATLALSLPSLVSGATRASGPCHLKRWTNESIRHFSRREIRCTVETLGPVKGGADRAICIADRESNLLPGAQNPVGPYDGLYQHLESSWDGRFAKYTDSAWSLDPSPFNGRTNAIVTIQMVVAFGTWKSAGWPRKGC